MLDYYCKVFGKSEMELRDIFCQLRALSKFGSDYYRLKIRNLWYKGMNIPEIAKKYDTSDKVIKYCLMFSNTKAKIPGTMKHLITTDLNLYETYLEAYIKSDGWQYCDRRVTNESLK